MSRLGSIGTQYFQNDGNPLVNGLLYVYESGTNTPKNTYSDFSLTIPNENPIQLSAAGRQPNVWFSGAARIILATEHGVQIEVRDPVGAPSTDPAFSDWNTNIVYDVQDLVLASDGNYYVSLTGGNTGNDPISDPANWTLVKFIRLWNVNEQYSMGDIGQGTDGLLYVSLTDNNTGNDPTTDATNWGASSSSGSGGGGVKYEYKSLLIEADTTHNWSGTEPYMVLVSGSGGGGGGAAPPIALDGGAGGGGAESYARIPIWVDQSIDPSVSVIIGTGGAASTTQGVPGNTGTETVFGGVLTILGGSGGTGSATDTPGADATQEQEPLPVSMDCAASGGYFSPGGGGGTGNSIGGASGAIGGDAMTTNFRVSSLDNTGQGGSPIGGWEGGGGGASWGDGGDGSATPTLGGGGVGANDSGGAGDGADGFILLEWWEQVEI